MLLPVRRLQVLPLLCAVCHLTLGFPTQTPSADVDVRSLQVNIPRSGVVLASLGSSISLPCLVSLSTTPSTSSASPATPRVKWSVVSGGLETQILVARGQRVKVSEAYRDRAALLNYTSSPDDLSLWLGDLRSSDSGHYRCEVQQGLEDASDLVELKVKGVVFHYRDALGRYAFTYHQAQRACETIGARIASAEQLLAAYYDGYEQCDAGWLADQSVRYPIQVPREGCYGDMDGQPGVRNYGTMDADDLFDVYCYVEQIDGEVFYDSVAQQLSLAGAQSYCRAAGAELATTAQLYLAWTEGLDRCSPGWLSDGSVRYPITTPRERCGGPQAGVKTLYRFSNQTRFPEPSSLHDVYCFKGSRILPTDSPTDYVATEPEDIGQDVVILTEADQELKLNPQSEQVEREAQSALESFPLVSSSEENTHTTESSLDATSTLDLLQPFIETTSSAETSSLRPTAPTNGTVRSTEPHDPPQNLSLPSVYREAGSHQSINISHLSEPDNTTGSAEPLSTTGSAEPLGTTGSAEPLGTTASAEHLNTTGSAEPLGTTGSAEATHTPYAQNQTMFDPHREISNYSGSDPTVENMTRVTPVTLDLQEDPDEAALEEPEQMSLSTQSRAGADLPTQPTRPPSKQQTPSLLPVDGSGDESQELDPDVESASGNSTSVPFTSNFTARPSAAASAGSATAQPRTQAPDVLILSSGAENGPTPTSAPLWDFAVSRQEGSASSEADDTIAMEEKQLYYTTPEVNLVSGTGLGTSQSPQPSKTSQMPADYSTAQYTTDYKEYLNAAANAFEEASGQEPGEAISIDSTVDFNDDLKFIGNITIVPNLEEEFNVSMSLEEEPNGSLSLGKEVKGPPTFSLQEEPQILEEGVDVTPPLEEDNVDPTPAPEAEVVFPESEEITGIAPTPALEEETAAAPTLDGFSVAPTFEDEANEASAVLDEASGPRTLENEANVASILEQEVTVAPTLQEEAISVTTFEGEPDIALSEDGVSFAPTLEGEPMVVEGLEEEASFALDIYEDAKASPTTQADFAKTSLHSFPSNGPTLTTTNRPQQSQNDLESSRAPQSLTTTAPPASLTSTRSDVASTETATVSTTTHSSGRVRSPTTSTARTSDKTTEPQKVTHLMPPLDHVEFSLTQPPTLLILPNERAAVGRAGKASDVCEDNPCLNGGTCTDRQGQIVCLCLPTYEGDLCQTDLERCEPGWDKFHGFCYRHFNQRLSWEVAEKQCRLMGAHLVSIMSHEEQDYISSNYKEYQWTGLNDKTIEDDFRWSDGNPLLYENWYRGQPDSYFLSGEDCVVMVWHDDGRWSDVPCNYHLAYTCKKSPTSCGPPPKVRNASLYGKVRQRYETNALVRYYCATGFQQSHNPLLRCLPGGRWEKPKILCIPAGLQTAYDEENNKFPVMEVEFEATTETPPYRDIKF